MNTSYRYLKPNVKPECVGCEMITLVGNFHEGKDIIVYEEKDKK